MRTSVKTVMVMVLLTLTFAGDLFGQCPSNLGFDNGVFSPWSTSTDSNFITPGSRIYYKPGLSPIVASYGSTDRWLGTISKPHPSCGNYLTRVGNAGINATADTVYRKYIIDSLSDKLTIYSRGVSEIAHNYWNLATIEAPGFGYEVYVNGKKLDCLKGAFFCGNADAPYVWNVGSFKDTSGVRKSVGWAKEVLNFACFVGDTIEVRLFTRDCIKLGHYAYAYFDVVCGDTTKPTISKIMVNDVIDADKLNLYCTNSTTLYLKPNTVICPVVRSNVNWKPSSLVIGATNLDSAKINMPDSGWVYAEADFSNFCTSVHVRDSIFIKKLNADPHDNLPKMPRNYCDCYSDTLNFGTTTVTTVKDQNGNSMTLSNGLLILKPCDNFYEESFWKSPSVRTTLNKSQIGTSSWVIGNSDGAIGQDSILAGGIVRYNVNYKSTKKFFVGINDKNVSNNNDMSHSIYYNGGVITAYYKGSVQASLGTYSANAVIEFKTLSNNRVEIWIDGVRKHTYSNSQKATFPVFADFAAQCNDTAIINKTSIFGPTKNIKDFTRLMVPTTFKYSIQYVDRCGATTRDTIKVIPGFSSTLSVPNNKVCGLTPVNITVSSPYIMDDMYSTTDGDGSVNTNLPVATYTPVTSDFGVPVKLIITSVSGRCNNPDTAMLTFNEVPVSNAGLDKSNPPATFVVGASPSGACTTCASIKHAWTPKVSLNDSSLANPTSTKAMLSTGYLVLKVSDPTTGCFSRDTMNILMPLPLHDLSLESNCTKDGVIDFKWTLTPTEDHFAFGIEYSNNDGETWTSLGHIKSDFNNLGVGRQEFELSIDKLKAENVKYRFYSTNIDNTKRTTVPIDLDCVDKTIYKVFPNPFTGNINVNINSPTSTNKQIAIQIFNEYGQCVYTMNKPGGNEFTNALFLLDGTENLGQGIYFLQVMSNDAIVYKTKITKMN